MCFNEFWNCSCSRDQVFCYLVRTDLVVSDLSYLGVDVKKCTGITGYAVTPACGLLVTWNSLWEMHGSANLSEQVHIPDCACSRCRVTSLVCVICSVTACLCIVLSNHLRYPWRVFLLSDTISNGLGHFVKRLLWFQLKSCRS